MHTHPETCTGHATATGWETKSLKHINSNERVSGRSPAQNNRNNMIPFILSSKLGKIKQQNSGCIHK